MAISSKSTQKTIRKHINKKNINKLISQIKPVFPQKKPLPAEVPDIRDWSKAAQEKRIRFIENETKKTFPYISGEKTFDTPHDLKGNIENYIGMAQVPTGLIGPLRINGTEAKGDFYIPLATTEGALVASYHRGSFIASLSGGITSVCLSEAVQRAPSFIFQDISEVGLFTLWLMENMENFKKIASEKTSHGKLEEIKINIEGNQTSLIFEYTTGDASGQNMVTFCTQAVCEYILKNSPVKPEYWFIEGNLSGDKKATATSFASVRGKKVTAEAIIKKEFVEKVLHTTTDRMMDYWKISILNGIQSGSIGVNGHFSNGLTALFLACGQDVACISEASTGTTRFDLTKESDLYVCVTLPNLIVGTVGGGTRFPTQRECLEILDCDGSGKARKFAEVCAATVLCGEISIVGAIVAGDFAKAHARFGRGG